VWRIGDSFRAGAIAGALVAFLALAAAPVGASEAPPVNDAYLQSLNLNQPHSKLDRVDTLTDTRNTSAATVQSDIFAPTVNGGPPEVTGCNGVSEGKTIWYDFFPDTNGLARIRTSANFGTVMAVMPFDPKSLLPELAGRKCAVNDVGKTQELFDQVQAGKSYTVQIGGVESAGGEVEFLFDYLVQLKRLSAEATLTAQPLASGIRIVSLSVSAPSKKARVLVRCSRGCSDQSKTGRNVSFGRLKGRVLSSGSTLRIYVTLKNEIGELIEYKIRSGSFKKSQHCLKPGTLKVQQCQ
jgi:hypothetical protein